MSAALHAAPVERRRLAPNVVCLFQEERAPIANERRRGRFPRGVVALWSRPRLMVGDMAEICGTALPSNHGKRVRLLGRVRGTDLPGSDWWEVRTVCEPLDVRDVQDLTSTRPTGRTDQAIVQGCNLRRVSNRAIIWRGRA